MQMIAQWLDSVGARAFGISATLFVLLNGSAIAVLAIRRDYTLVNRWTSRLLAANLVLLGTGLGLPLATTLARSVVMAVAPLSQGVTTGKGADARQSDGDKRSEPRVRR
jgi:predicted tellurium resistance membrane protein TerC